jgi:hypothetical protein
MRGYHQTPPPSPHPTKITPRLGSLDGTKRGVSHK